MTSESPELARLFHTYTSGSDTIGRTLAAARVELGVNDPLIVATGRDIALFPGRGRPPEVQSFRMGNRGFKELAGISHLGPAIGSLVLTRKLRGDESWRSGGQRLLEDVESGRAANSAELWRDVIAVEAFRGIEQPIADMIDYTCAVTARYLRRALADNDYLNAETLHKDYLAGDGSGDLPVPVNHMMVATFFLTALDISYRVMRWFDHHEIDWPNAMAMVVGKQGRPTAGVTWNTSSVATIIMGVARGRLPLERLYMAPHAPIFDTPADGDLSEVAAMEPVLRGIWFSTRVTVELGRTMFPGYPRFQPNSFGGPDLDLEPLSVISEMPVIHSPNDFTALVSRMRMVLEDPRQLLSGSVADFVIEQLVANDNDPSKVIVPGLTGVHYPVGL